MSIDQVLVQIETRTAPMQYLHGNLLRLDKTHSCCRREAPMIVTNSTLRGSGDGLAHPLHQTLIGARRGLQIKLDHGLETPAKIDLCAGNSAGIEPLHVDQWAPPAPMRT